MNEHPKPILKKFVQVGVGGSLPPMPAKLALRPAGLIMTNNARNVSQGRPIRSAHAGWVISSMAMAIAAQPTLAKKSSKPSTPAKLVPPDGAFASPTPRYQFAETLPEQEAQLATNPLMQRFAASRKALASDPFRPAYHYELSLDGAPQAESLIERITLSIGSKPLHKRRRRGFTIP